MEKKAFIKLLELYDDFLKCSSDLCEIGFDLNEGKYPLATKTERMFDLFIHSQYTTFGVEWIFWFVYENGFGRKQLKAYDGDSLVCQTVEKLHEYVKQYETTS